MTRLPALAAALALAGCLPGDPDTAEKPSGPLYRCIGEPPYDPAAWPQIRRDAEASIAERCREDAMSSALKAVVPAATVDSARLHLVVLDDRCRLVNEQTSQVPATPGQTSFRWFWDAKDAQGRPVPTGEYYLNSEVAWSDGRRDTTYAKAGYINTACP